jgi:hypothetical protein
MRKPECPICHASAVNAGKLRYCPQCGWQKKETEAQLRLNLKIVPFVFGLMVVLVAFLFLRSGWRQQNAGLIGLFLSFPLIALFVSYGITRRNLKILLAQPAPVVPASGTSQAAVGSGAQLPALNPKYEAVLRTSPPRAIRLSRRGTFNLSLVLVVLLAFVSIMLAQLYKSWAVTKSFADFQFREWGMMGFALLLLLILVSQWRAMARERDLLENGEVAVGKIVQIWGSRSASAIKYEFQDNSGETHRQTGTDYTQKLQEGMSVPVFYDRENASRQVPACGTYHEVILPEQGN